MTDRHHQLYIPRGLAACTFSWCASLGIFYGRDVATDDPAGVTLYLASTADRAKLVAMIEKQCAALRPYNPSFAALYGEVR